MINTIAFSISVLLVLVLSTVSGYMQYDLIGNSTTQRDTASTLQIGGNNANQLYQYAQTLNGLLLLPTSKDVLKHIINNEILTTNQIETLNNRTDVTFTIFDDPLNELYTQYISTIPRQNFGVISNHEITNEQYRNVIKFKSIFGGTKAGISRIILWLNTHNS